MIGSGAIGTAVARLAVAAGIGVVLSNSRGPLSLAGVAAELGVRAGTVAEAVAAGDFVLLAVPLRAATSLPRDPLDGTIVLDTSNYYPGRDGAIAELDSDELTTSEYVQRHLPGARIVKAFANVSALHLVAQARPHGAPDRSGLAIAGDDPEAVEAVAGLVDRLGFDPVNIGGLAGSWRIEPDTTASASAYFTEPFPMGVSMAEKLAFLTATPAAPLPAAELRSLVAGAVRVPAGGEWPTD